MFERTLEAQALDAGHANVSPFSIALAIHAGLIVIALGISLLIVPKVIVPPPPDDTVIKLFVEPVEFKLERPAPVQEPAIRRGVENPGPALVPPAETPRHDAPPVETPPDLPAPENPVMTTRSSRCDCSRNGLAPERSCSRRSRRGSFSRRGELLVAMRPLCLSDRRRIAAPVRQHRKGGIS